MNFQETVEEIIEGFITDLRQHGIYAESVMTGVERAPDVEEEQMENLDLDSATAQDMFSAGRLRVVGQGIASVNDFAWEDRNLYPEKFEEENKLSENLMLDEEEAMRAEFERKAEDWWDED